MSVAGDPFDKERAAIRRSFDAAAERYDAAAVLQREVADRMAERLQLVRLQATRLLDAGSGTGYAATALKQRFPDARLIELDLALGMLQVSAAKTGRVARWLGRANWQICADIEAMPLASASVDLVWSNLTIQWLDTPDAAFAEFHRVLRPEGLLMFSTLGPDTLMEMRAAFAAADGAPHVNRFIDMHDLGDALTRTGFAAPVMDMEKIVLTYADMKAALRDLKAIGAHSAASGRPRGLFGKAAFARAEAAYERFRRDGRLPATFEVVYGHAWKPAPKPQRPDGTQVIEFRPRR
jgi:malonyl-CoA O-methyltransferase